MKQQLNFLLERNLIDEQIMLIVLEIQNHLANKWQIDITAPSTEILLTHLANALGRIKRNCTVSALQKDVLLEIKSAVNFAKVLAIHEEILAFMPFPIPENEQSYFLANIYLVMKTQQI